jgi:choline dehydrogenase-like flavoprotein
LRRGAEPIGQLDWHTILPFRSDAASGQLGWVGLQAARCRAEPAFEHNVPALAHHRLVFVARSPDELELRFDGVKRHNPSPVGSITLVPAGNPVWARSSGHKDELHIFLDAGSVARVTPRCRGRSQVQSAGRFLALAAGVVRPKSRGRIRLTGPSPLDPVQIEANFLSDPADVRTAIAAGSVARSVTPPHCAPSPNARRCQEV